MSFLGKGNRRGRRLTALVAGGALAVFQALAVIGAPAASAAVACTVSSGVVAITLSAGGDALVAQIQSTGQIFFNGSGALCGVAVLTSNTTAISITGGAGDQTVTIDLFDELGAGTDWGTINWTMNLGSDGVAGDSFIVDNSGSDTAVTEDWGASGVDLNGDGDLDVVLAGTENFTALASGEGDTINAGGSTATGAAFASDITITGGAGDDTLTGGAGNDTLTGGAGDDTIAGGLGDDSLDGGLAGEDAVDYSGSATAVNVNLLAGLASGEGVDTLTGFEDIIGSALGDTLTGDTFDNVITPGAGDDKVSGGDGSDTVDYSDATAAVTVDLSAGTETGGSGNDTLSGIENATGSDFNDSLTGDDTDNVLDGGAGNDSLAGGGGDTAGDTLIGGAGIDTVDYGWATSVTLSLNCKGTDGVGAPSDTAPIKDDIQTMENAILTAGDDSFTGNEFANRVFPNGGQNSLDGGDGTSCGGFGGDVLDYSVGYTAGVTVNMAGGATAGDSAVGFESAVGTKFADNITGNADSNTINGKGGNDSIKGGSGDDTLRGAKGNDFIRGGAGDDDLFGSKGDDTLFGGSGDDLGKGGPGKDVCKSIEVARSCGTKKHPSKRRP